MRQAGRQAHPLLVIVLPATANTTLGLPIEHPASVPALPLRRLYSKPLAAAFEKRADLRVTICAALRRVCTQNRAALAAAGQPVGQADPCAAAGGEEGGSPEEQAHLEVPDSYTAEMAQE